VPLVVRPQHPQWTGPCRLPRRPRPMSCQLPCFPHHVVMPLSSFVPVHRLRYHMRRSNAITEARERSSSCDGVVSRFRRLPQFSSSLSPDQTYLARNSLSYQLAIALYLQSLHHPRTFPVVSDMFAPVNRWVSWEISMEEKVEVRRRQLK
jgi:hypothetical protein